MLCAVPKFSGTFGYASDFFNPIPSRTTIIDDFANHLRYRAVCRYINKYRYLMYIQADKPHGYTKIMLPPFARISRNQIQHDSTHSHRSGLSLDAFCRATVLHHLIRRSAFDFGTVCNKEPGCLHTRTCRQPV